MSTTLDAAKTRAGVKLARQVFLLRLLGLGLGAVAVGGVLYEQGYDWPAWALLFGNGYIWPFVAYALSRRSSNPRAQEQRNLIVDSA
ncbi:MASE2 domain-containing protein, partial [Hydrocarboniphaga effusa]